jgi:predicted enzyme related to lactoylglutathione lyase
LLITKEDPMAGIASLIWLDLECADPPALADFYHQLLGWDVIDSHPDYAVIGDGSARIRFGRVDGYRGPGWPGRRHVDGPH